jgi:Pentapeptide repeats (8 copies)
MKADRHIKILLALVAIALFLNALNPWLRPVPVAARQPPANLLVTPMSGLAEEPPAGGLGLATPTQVARNTPANPVDMQRVIALHERWLATDGAEGARADLREINLEGNVGRGGDLLLIGGLILREVNLSRADIRFARLRHIDLGDANLTSAELNGSDLERATLDSADLTHADLRDANLRAAILTGANLADADLRNADLRGADLDGARCLTEAQIRSATTDAFTRLPRFEVC